MIYASCFGPYHISDELFVNRILLDLDTAQFAQVQTGFQQYGGSVTLREVCALYAVVVYS